MPGKPGRPTTLDHNVITSVIIEHKSDLVQNNCLVSKKGEIWSVIGDKVNKSGSSVYSYVANNRNGIKNILLPTENQEPTSLENETESFNLSTDSNDSSTEETEVKIYISKDEFSNLLVQKVYSR